MEALSESRGTIDAWLFDYNEQECRLRDHYLATGELLSREKYQERFPDPHTRDEEPPQGAPTWGQILTDSMFIGQHADVAIVKHPRYLNRFDHSHTFFEISYVVKGACHHTVNAYGAEESVSLQAGDVFILPPAISHSILTDGDSVVINILMRAGTFEDAFLRRIPPDNVLSRFFSDILYSKSSANFLLYRTDDNPLIRSTVYGILQEYHFGKLLSSDILGQLLGLFFLYLLRECADSIQISRGHHREAQCIPAIVHYLERHYATATIGGLARDLGYNISHLSRLYKKHTGMSLRETLGRIRVRHACELLQKSDWSVDDIATAVGYGDVSSFIRRFRLQVGTTPLRYRRQGRTQ